MRPAAVSPMLAGAAGARYYASFWQRFGAALVDGLILVFPIAGARAILGETVGQFAVSLMLIAYDIHFLTANGMTPGKRVLRIRVVDAAGAIPNRETVLRRHAFTIIGLISAAVVLDPLHLISSAWLIFGLVDILWMCRDERWQTLHDRAAGTFVIRACPTTRPLTPRTAPSPSRPSAGFVGSARRL